MKEPVMALNLPTPVTAEEPIRPRRLLLVIMTALTLAAVAGAGAWPARSQRETVAVRSQAQSTAAHNVLAPADQPIAAGSSDGGVGSREEDSAFFVYLVDSEERTEAPRHFSADVNTLRGQMGQPPVSISVLNVTGWDADVVAHMTNMPGLSVIDLRTP
jgi:hypothetical protein